MKSKIQSAFVVIAIALTISGCKKQDYNAPMSTSSGSPGANEVWIQNMAFNPSSITVAVNTTITWTNKDAVAHTVTSNTGLFESGNLNSGATYSHKFTAAGSYSYKCSIHPSMTATVTVH